MIKRFDVANDQLVGRELADELKNRLLSWLQVLQSP